MTATSPRIGGRAQRIHWTVLAVALLALFPLRAISESHRDDLQIKPRTASEAAGLWETMMTSGAGSLRAFAILFTWFQINEAEDNREYFRLVQLYENVKQLQPRNTKVQRFLADQLMDNIAPNQATNEGRWKWVAQGKQYLDEATARNVRAYDLHSALHFYWFKRMTDYPIHILEAELARGDACLFRLEPAWQALAERTVADFHALPAEEQLAFRHAVDRIGFLLAYSSNIAQFTEYRQLSRDAQSIYRRCNLLRLIGALLSFEFAMQPSTGLAPEDQARSMRWLAPRVWDVLVRSEGSVEEVAEARARVWEHAVRAWMRIQNLLDTGKLDDADPLVNFSRDELRSAWRVYPPTPGTLSPDDAAIADSHFGSGKGGR
ncbi:MAG: hypothetical protein AB7K09_04840 [Planctomycetota bacterium]